ncbi:uncharacterized protein ALTATR162_LOCUS6091 [Alternaria atra]|uniref:CCR4-NOT transcription complex subunit 11 n=1 Tax=Alternaria atra TaxID=119953 RepID=A0A8J2N286_9PLEO|nr:uncharacterized protein ALTATR162_LOCUS6091 [Alternaria atra]CAG5161768.1 unnamed protein product [Alternaria atra]
MSFMTATLTAAEINALSDPTKSNDDAIRDLDAASHSFSVDVAPFFQSIRVKNTLDAYVERAKLEPSLQVLVVILNCEYKLWKAHEEISMRHKPYLTHWVEALMKTNEESAKEHVDTLTSSGTKAGPSTADIRKTRARYITVLLSEEPSSSQATPQTILAKLHDEDALAAFDPLPYMQMLVEEEVWDKLPESQVRASERPAQKPIPTAKEKKSLHKGQAQEVDSSQSWDDVILRKLKEEPEQAVQELEHLPLEIPSLDFLTKLHVNRTFEDLGIDGQDVTLHYIQHALRLIEKMEAPPPTSQQDTTTNGPTNGVGNGIPIVEYGKEAQSRAVIILLLFIKSSISKGFLEATSLFFELQEICVRYVWIKEVRDFRAWAQGQLGN